MNFPVRHQMRNLITAFLLTIMSCSKVNAFIEDSLKQKPVYIFQVDRRNSFIHSHHIGINGVLLGVQFKNRHQFSLGFYCLEPWKKPDIITRLDSSGSYRESVKFNLYYGSLGYKYTFLRKGIISMSIPFEIGFGEGHAKVILLDYNIKAAAHTYFIPLQIGCFLKLRLTRWFAIFGSVGYRCQVLEKLFEKPGININYNGMYYHYGVSIYIKSIIQDIKKAKNKNSIMN
jgi:hypothetical protein